MLLSCSYPHVNYISLILPSLCVSYAYKKGIASKRTNDIAKTVDVRMKIAPEKMLYIIMYVWRGYHEIVRVTIFYHKEEFFPDVVSNGWIL